MSWLFKDPIAIMKEIDTFCLNNKSTRANNVSFLAPFIVQNCKIILTADPELWGRMHHSGS